MKFVLKSMKSALSTFIQLLILWLLFPALVILLRIFGPELQQNFVVEFLSNFFGDVSKSFLAADTDGLLEAFEMMAPGYSFMMQVTLGLFGETTVTTIAGVFSAMYSNVMQTWFFALGSMVINTLIVYVAKIKDTAILNGVLGVSFSTLAWAAYADKVQSVQMLLAIILLVLMNFVLRFIFLGMGYFKATFSLFMELLNAGSAACYLAGLQLYWSGAFDTFWSGLGYLLIVLMGLTITTLLSMLLTDTKWGLDALG